MKVYKTRTRTKLLRAGGSSDEEEENKVIDKIANRVVSKLLGYMRTHRDELIEMLPVPKVVEKHIVEEKHIEVPVAVALPPPRTEPTTVPQAESPPKEFVPSVEIDESIIDVGVSVEGMEKTTDQPIAQSESTEDQLSSVEKLRQLKKGK